eukprot:CAMPEP_0181188188 /NCGR_PEP_ID=MMETSP1096-20121128/10977_1 /TAXON_ID=156174 ORGANISM="Chrysochromulina ericina, Strain CCMP281" /NCGR_SAMPLE_ID=MMETSP1096 /ASSEMBLY_ACC=CAM_ASM_000453 /LENGTH=79 /DNA_ID=CAMNT_0023277221 /DNA_START=217 /DNA_END=456 /DNA_ORIENTATION=-
MKYDRVAAPQLMHHRLAAVPCHEGPAVDSVWIDEQCAQRQYGAHIAVIGVKQRAAFPVCVVLNTADSEWRVGDMVLLHL